MSAAQRRKQLLEVSKHLFAQAGYDATTVEEIAAQAGVSKPVVYSHFGGKEGVYAVLVDREVNRLLDRITLSITNENRGRDMVRASALAFLDYIDEDPDAFRVLVRDAPASMASGTVSGLLDDVADKAADVISEFFTRSDRDTSVAPIYANALVGMIAHVGTWWSANGEISKEAVADHVTALVFSGLAHLPVDVSKHVAKAKRPKGAISGEDIRHKLHE